LKSRGKITKLKIWGQNHHFTIKQRHKHLSPFETGYKNLTWNQARTATLKGMVYIFYIN
jgi:hypothetical protein